MVCHTGIGVWNETSFLNHADKPNATRLPFGSLCFFTANLLLLRGPGILRHGKTFSSGAITRGKILFYSGEIHARQPATSSLIGSFFVQRKTSLQTRRSPSLTSMPVPTMPSRPPGWRAWGFQTRPCESVPGAGKRARATPSSEVSSRASPADASKAPEKEGLCRRRSACYSSSTPKPAPFGAGARLCSGFGA